MNSSTDAPSDPATLLRAEEAARLLALSPRRLWELTNRGQLPVVRLGRAVRYRRQDLIRFVEAHLHGGSAGALQADKSAARGPR